MQQGDPVLRSATFVSSMFPLRLLFKAVSQHDWESDHAIHKISSTAKSAAVCPYQLNATSID